jgi:hypothetical protein
MTGLHTCTNYIGELCLTAITETMMAVPALAFAPLRPDPCHVLVNAEDHHFKSFAISAESRAFSHRFAVVCKTVVDAVE